MLFITPPHLHPIQTLAQSAWYKAVGLTKSLQNKENKKTLNYINMKILLQSVCEIQHALRACVCLLAFDGDFLVQFYLSSVAVDSNTKSSSISDATSRASDNMSTADSNPDKGDGNNLRIGAKLGDAAEDGDDNVNEDDRDKADDGVHLEEEKFASEESEEEWEDWDENTSDSGHKVTGGVISDEIETELSQMSGSGEPRQFGGRKVPTSPDPYRPGSSSPAAAEWSDVAFDSRLGAPSTPEHLKSNVIGGESDRDRATIGSGAGRSLSHADSKQTSAKGLKLVAKSKTTAVSSTKAAQAKKPAAAADDLGLGYDIKSIELTAVKEVDFFADMTPDIKPTLDKNGVVSGVAPEEGVASGSMAEGHVASDRFAVADTTKEVRILSHRVSKLPVWFLLLQCSFFVCL